MLSASQQRGQLKPRPDLAGVCREAKECGLGPYDITERFLAGPDSSWPNTFDEKQHHFLRLFYDSGGKERRKRTINVLEDFPMAFAQDAEEFYRILESLIDDDLLRYEEASRVRGDWVNGIQNWYRNVLLTPSGKRAVLSYLTPPVNSSNMPSNNFHVGDGANINFVQGNNATQTNVSGNNSSANVVSGHHNNQANQSGSPASMKDLVEQLKPLLQDAAFESQREEIDEEFERIEAQLKKPEPKKSLLERSFDYLKDMAVKSAGPATATAVIELIKHAPALLEAASHLG